jgi:hypothetical protein
VKGVAAKGRCSSCGREIALYTPAGPYRRVNTAVRPHLRYGASNVGRRCAGSGHPPASADAGRAALEQGNG